MPELLPGMPLQLGDPGVFVCGPADIAPWESEPAPRVRKTTYAAARQLATTGRWLVLSMCPDCLPRTKRYCSNHDRSNWWLENFRPR